MNAPASLTAADARAVGLQRLTTILTTTSTDSLPLGAISQTKIAQVSHGMPQHARTLQAGGQQHFDLGMCGNRDPDPSRGPMMKICVDRLLDAIGRYDPSGCYDEVFTEVSERIGERGEAGKADICVLIAWKRAVQGRWITDFLLTPAPRSETGHGRRSPPPRISSVWTRSRRCRVSQQRTRWPRWCSPLMTRPSSASWTGVR
jgi:hypothetical protein